jgi:hypothetical protein
VVNRKETEPQFETSASLVWQFNFGSQLHNTGRNKIKKVGEESENNFGLQSFILNNLSREEKGILVRHGFSGTRT